MFKTIGKIIALASLTLFISCEKGCDKKDGAEKKLGVFFENLKDNDEVESPVTVKFGVHGMTVRPALEDVNDKTSGHHHILIDNPAGFIEKGRPIPVDPRHVHYGKGEVSTTLELTPGVHTLSLQFGDGAHLSYGKEMAASVTVKVKAKAEDAGRE